MKKLKEDKEIRKILKDGMLLQAPSGMIDRIMANISVSSARRLTVKAVEPKSYIASLVPIITGILVAIAAFLKPETRFSFSLDQYFNLNINPIWIAPMLVILLTVWGYIFITRKDSAIKNHLAK